LDLVTDRLFIALGIARIDSFKCPENQQSVFQTDRAAAPLGSLLLATDPGGYS